MAWDFSGHALVGVRPALTIGMICQLVCHALSEFDKSALSPFLVALERLHLQTSLFTTGVIPPSMRGNSS